MPIYTKPNSAITKDVNNVGVFIGVMLLGPIFFLCIGMLGHFLLSLILTLVIGIPLWSVGLGSHQHPADQGVVDGLAGWQGGGDASHGTTAH